ncbi:MAG: PPC domain-containing protein [Pirellulales bacterium]|nr:PPC domain-containing protein [Pirellulales bacterium]
MNKAQWLAVLGLAGMLAAPASVLAQPRPYIGYVYPAGGQQGTTFPVKLGGQGLDGVDRVIVTGQGVSAKIVKYYSKLGPQEMSLLREQVNLLKRKKPKAADDTMMMEPDPDKTPAAPDKDKAKQDLIEKIEDRMREYVNRPACVSISALVYIEVTMASDAEPGPRELRLATPRGVSNPLAFHVGQLPEVARKPMLTADFQVLGKEELAQRKRPPEEVEQRITVPCTVNGQIASGEVNHYRFEASKGQRLVITTCARQLIPYIADAVPGWFQPVLALYHADGTELAYSDDYRFKPDPTIYYEVPEDGEYVFTVTDAIYRGREDFVYRITIGELPFVTSIFPLGGKAGEPATLEMKGWNLDATDSLLPAPDAGPGLHTVAARNDGLVSNLVPFALDALAECRDKEANNDRAAAQKVALPVIVNGRMDRPGDVDVFQIAGRAGDTIVAEVSARRLDSPLDSVLRVTDASGNLLAMNDDHEDAGSGVNTHHADSYVLVKLPADGDYYVHLADTARNGGEEYGYRLRISEPVPDFALRIVPSSLALRSKGSNPVTVYAIRKDGFSGPISLGLKEPPKGFSSAPVTLPGTQAIGRLLVKTDLAEAKEPVSLVVEGRAKVGDREIAREAVPAEDRMQAFLWRHLVPAEDFKVLVYDPSYTPTPKRIANEEAIKKKAEAVTAKSPETAKFTKRQVEGRLRQLKALYEEGLLTDEFYEDKAAECEAAL